MKDFLKHVSIYGILPVSGKFIGFFLVPIYTRVFSSYEFGVVELILTLTSFLIFACNLEFYSAIGRFFYDKENIEEKKKLISTGLLLTLASTVIVVIISFLAEDFIKRSYFDNTDYIFEFRISLVWLFFASVSTYLSVIPRYDKKPQLYILINISSLVARVGSTILFVLVLKTGIVGVIYGEVVGTITATILNAIISAKYLGFFFCRHDAKEIIRFAIPIVPGLLIFGAWAPLSRNLITKHFSIETLGLFSFAVRIASVMKIASGAIKLAWNPLLFENYKKDTFKKDLYKISWYTGLITFSGAIFITLLSPEISRYIGTTEYYDSRILIGFLAFGGVLEILSRLRGFGPLILKKTYILSIVELIGLIIGTIAFWLISGSLGLIGIGFIFLLHDVIKYYILVSYTKRKIEIKFSDVFEKILMILLLGAIIMIIYDVVFIVRIALLLFVIFNIGLLIWKKKVGFITNAEFKN